MQCKLRTRPSDNHTPHASHAPAALCLLWLQVLVYHDLLGMMSHPHHAKVTPKFCKRYAEVGQVIQSALAQYRQDVEDGSFPSQQYSPYKIPEGELELLVQHLQESGMHEAANAVQQAAKATAVQQAVQANGGTGGHAQAHAASEVAGGVGGSTARVA